MNVASAYIVANGQSGYDFIEKTSQTATKPFTIPTEEFATEKSTQKMNDGKTKPFEAGSFDFKDWRSKLDPAYDIQMYTKTEPARSDEEIIKDIVELAKKHAQQGIDRDKDKEYLDLMEEYISSVSPDREGILNRSVNEIIGRTSQGEDYSMDAAFQQVDSQRTKKDKEDEKELIDYLLESLKTKGSGKINGDVMGKIINDVMNRISDGNISNNAENVDITNAGNYYVVSIDHGGGMKTNFTYDFNGEFLDRGLIGNNYTAGDEGHGSKLASADFKDDNGDRIATYLKDFGFHSSPTKAETERRQEIATAYNAGYDFALGKYSPPSQPPFASDFKPYEELKEIYESTYRGLTNSIVA